MIADYEAVIPLRWTAAVHRRNFEQVLQLFDGLRCEHRSSGLVFTCPQIYSRERFLHWEAKDNLICIREHSLGKPLVDNAVVLRLSGNHVLRVHITVSSEVNSEELHLWMAFYLHNGNIETLLLKYRSSQRQQSALGTLVLASEGRIVNLVGLPECFARQTHEVSNAGGAAYHFTGSIEGIPEDKVVTSCEWVTHKLLALGLSGGDTLLVEVNDQSSAAVRWGTNTLSYNILKDKGSGLLQSIVTGLLGSNSVRDFDLDTIAIGSMYGGSQQRILSVNRVGEVRIWSCNELKLWAMTSIEHLLRQSSTLQSVYPTIDQSILNGAESADGGTGIWDILPKEPSRPLLLFRDGMVRTASEGPDCSTNKLPVAAVALLIDNTSGGALPGRYIYDGSDSAAKPFGIDEPLVESWKVFLLSWGGVPGNANDNGAYLLAEAISFPPQAVSIPGASFVSATLVDMNIDIDETNLLTLSTVWRVILQDDANREAISFGRVLGTLSLSLAAYRCTLSGKDQMIVPKLQITCPSSFYDFWRRRVEDDLRLSTLATVVANGGCEVHAVQSFLLQRVFSEQRFSTNVVRHACASFLQKAQSLETEISGTALGSHNTTPMDTWQSQELWSSLYPQQEIGWSTLSVEMDNSCELCDDDSVLVDAVVDVCDKVAKVRLATGGDNITDLEQSYCVHLILAVTEFLAECEIQNLRTQPANTHCLLYCGTMSSLSSIEPLTCFLVGGVAGGYSFMYEIEVDPFFMEADHSDSLVGPTVAISRGVDDATIFQPLPNRQAGCLLSILDQFFNINSKEYIERRLIKVDHMLLCFLQEQQMDSSCAHGISMKQLQWLGTELKDCGRDFAAAHITTVLDLISPMACCDEHGTSFLDVLLASESFDGSSRCCSQLQHALCIGTADASSIGDVNPTIVNLLVDLVRKSLRSHQRSSKLLLILLHIVLEEGDGSLHHSIIQLIRDIYIPQATARFVSFTSLLWLDEVRPCDTQHLRVHADLAHFLPLRLRSRADANQVHYSNIQNYFTLFSGAISSCLGSELRRASFTLDYRRSVLRNFLEYLAPFMVQYGADKDISVARDDLSQNVQAWSRLLLFVWRELEPVPTSYLTSWLFECGQYACLTRWLSPSTLEQYGVGHATEAFHSVDFHFRKHFGEQSTAVLKCAHSMVSFRTRTIIAIAALYSRISCDDDWCGGMNLESNEGAATERERYILEILISLVHMARGICPQFSTIPNVSNSLEIISASIPESADRLLATGSGNGIGGAEDINSALQKSINATMSSFYCELQNQLLGCVHPGLHRDVLRFCCCGLVLLHEATLCIGLDPLLRAVFSSTLRHDAAALNFLQEILSTSPNLYGLSLEICFMNDLLELIERSKLFMPSALRCTVAVDIATVVADTVSSALDIYQPLDKLTSEIEAMHSLLYAAWSTVFEYSLQRITAIPELRDGDAHLSQALDAVLRLAELESIASSAVQQPISQLSFPGVISTSSVKTEFGMRKSWLHHLRVLISAACRKGYLHWLCRVPQQKINFPSIHLSDAIIATLIDLAAVSNVPKLVPADSNGESIFSECLFVFLLCQRDFQQAAKVMFDCARKILPCDAVSSSNTSSDCRLLSAAAVACRVLSVREGGYILTHSASGGYSESSVMRLYPQQQPSRLSLIDRIEVDMLCAVTRSTLTLSLKSRQFGHTESGIFASDNMECIILSLCNVGEFRHALSLALLCDEYRSLSNSTVIEKLVGLDLKLSSGLNFFRDIAIIALARGVENAYVALSNGSSSIATAYSLDNYFYGPDLSFIEIASDAVRRSSDAYLQRVLFQQLTTMLYKEHLHIDRRLMAVYGPQRSDLIIHALRSMLSISPRAFLPRTLMDEVARIEVTDRQSKKQSSSFGNIGAVIRILTDFDRTEEACHYICKLLEDSMITHNGASGTWIPYEAIDRLLHRLDSVNYGKNIHKERLEIALKTHFARLLADSC